MRTTAEALCLALALALPARAEEALCAGLTAGLRAVPGYQLTAPPAGPEDGWCVLDGATLRSLTPGWPNLHAARLRFRAAPGEVSLDLSGLRIAPRLGDTTIDERLRALFRLQSAELRLQAVEAPEGGGIEVRNLVLTLSGGTELGLTAGIRGARLDPAALAGGVVTRLDLHWRNDGRFLRPVMELVGARLTGAEGGAAVDVARDRLAGVLAALPEAALAEDARDELEHMVAALPQGRGRLTLSLTSDDGIGAARLALAVLSGDPFGPQALERLLAGARIEADWQPGLAP
jgi:hypothetical protein